MKNELTAKRLRLALSNKDMRPQDLAEKSGVSKASISQYMNGSHSPSNISSGKMSKVLDVNPLWLMGFDVSMARDVKASTTVTLYNVHCETEREAKLVLAYRELSDISQKKMDTYAQDLVKLESAHQTVNAAHDRTDIETTDEMKEHDDDIMDGDEF